MNEVIQADVSWGAEASGEAALERLAKIASQLGSVAVSRDATDLAARLKEGRFHLACVGQFKRGKSTLLNALLGERLLPAGITPVTSVPTIIRHGAVRSVRVRLKDARWMQIDPATIADYVSEESNSENRRGVVAMEVFSPNPLLTSGVCLVDTPGLGSVFAGNTATTEEFIPHIDAALIVLGADPPISGAELDLIQRIAEHAENLLVVLNKSDKSSNADLEAAKTFAHRVLEDRLQRPIGHIYEVSAEEILKHHSSQRDWPLLLAAINEISARSGDVLVHEAGRRGVERLSRQLLALIASEAGALTRPIAESEARIANLRSSIDKAQQSLRDLDPLFAAEQSRLTNQLLSRRSTFLASATPPAEAELDKLFSAIPHRFGPEFRAAANQKAIEKAERGIIPWLKSEQATAEREYQAAADRFAAIGNDFLQKCAAEQSEGEIPTNLSIDGFTVPSRFTFESFLRIARPASPVRYLADVFLGAFGSFSVIEADVREFLVHLLETNSMRVHSDTVDRLDKSRAKLQLEIRVALSGAGETAQHSLDRARDAKSEGEAAVRARLEQLATLNREIVNTAQRDDAKLGKVR
jgi:GTP-binding protein EngB required for normal cell division